MCSGCSGHQWDDSPDDFEERSRSSNRFPFRDAEDDRTKECEDQDAAESEEQYSSHWGSRKHDSTNHDDDWEILVGPTEILEVRLIRVHPAETMLTDTSGDVAERAAEGRRRYGVSPSFCPISGKDYRTNPDPHRRSPGIAQTKTPGLPTLPRRFFRRAWAIPGFRYLNRAWPANWRVAARRIALVAGGLAGAWFVFR